MPRRGLRALAAGALRRVRRVAPAAPLDNEARRLEAVRELHRHEAQLKPAYKHWGYKNVFAKGFIGVRGVDPELPRDRWVRVRLGEWHFALDSDLEYRLAGDADVAVLVLGHAFDDAGAAGRDAVPQRILEVARADVRAGQARTAVDEVLTWLSGRFVVFVWRGGELDVYGDPMATRACYYLAATDVRVAAPSASATAADASPFPNTVPLPGADLPGTPALPPHLAELAPAVASHTQLLARYAGGLTHHEQRWARLHPDYKDEFGKWIPGVLTPHDHVRQVSANCRLTIGGGEIAHRRFFPPVGFRREERSAEAVFPEFRDELRQQVRNWAQTHREVSLPLTAGRDSRGILAAGLVDLQDAGALTFTYHPFHVPQKSTVTDLDVAGRLSAAAGLPHLVVDVRPVKRDRPFDRLYRATFPTYPRYAALAGALYVSVPARAATLFGVGGGIITGMFRNTEDQTLSAETLARKFTASKFGESPELRARIEQWFAYTEFTEARLAGFSIYDLFHWEHRMSKWGAEGYLEYDLATVPAPVLNSRRLLLTALSLPEVDRKAKVLYDLLEQTDPPTPAEPAPPAAQA
jgi:hypothetical protein